MKCDALGSVVFRNRIEQAHDAGVDEVVQVHMDRKTLVHPYGDRLHQWKMIEHNLVAAFPRNLLPAYSHTSLPHRVCPLFRFLSGAGLAVRRDLRVQP